MKLSVLKLNKVRKAFKVVVDDLEEEILVYNILDEDRNKVLEMLGNAEEGKELELGKSIYELLFEKCTNLEIDCDISEVLDNPSDIVSLVSMELHEILHELQLEAMAMKLLELNDLENRIKVVLIEEKTERIESLIEEIKEKKKEDKEKE